MAKEVTIGYIESNEDQEVQRRTSPQKMTKKEVIKAVSDWYDAIGTKLNDFDSIHFFVKEAAN